MHAALKVGWAGQTFALARCSDSRGKKTRNRVSKEERKTMIESFIKTYQISNNGNFPSLNLTHKEVGGSFYTVREIVREIIQENKILRPGNPNSQALTLDDCADQLTLESFSHESSSPLSLAINGHATDERQKEVHCFSIGHQSINEEVITTSYELSSAEIHETIEIVSQQITASHSDQIVFPELVKDEMLSGSQESNYHRNGYLSGASTSVNYSGADSTKQSQLGKYKPQSNDEQVHIEDQDDGVGVPENGKLSHAVGVHQTIYNSSTSDAILLENSELNTSTFEAASSSTEKSVSEFAVADTSEIMVSMKTENFDFRVSDEPKGLSDSFQSGEDFTLSSISTPSSKSHHSKDGLTGPSEALEANTLANEKELDSVPLDSDTIIRKINPATNNSSSISDDGAEMGLETPLSNTSDCLISEIAGSKVESLVLLNDVLLENASNGLETDSEQLPPPAIKLDSETKAELKHDTSNTDIGRKKLLDGMTSEPSEDSQKQQETTEADPIWSAIKGFFAAFIKFWTE